MPSWRTTAALAATLAYDIELIRDLPPVERASEAAVPVQVVVGERSPAGVHAARFLKPRPGQALPA